AQEIANWSWLPFDELAWRIISPFVGPAIPEADLKALLKDCYRAFAHRAVAPLRQVDRNEWVLELFHGPTLAFKDFALQLLGRLLDHVLVKRGERVVIMGATS
ncbi:threonine synthase, partial [Agrobacterium tumefaciens]|nr:threonine synthase [Agrobacterium tumefaciens]